MLTDSNSETAHLQCITMGWLPVLLCTLLTSSITSVTVFRLEQLPSGAQLVMWNWLTCCALPDCKREQITCHTQCHHLPSGTDLGILDVHSPQHKALQPLLPQQLHCELTIALGATAGPVLVAHLLQNEDIQRLIKIAWHRSIPLFFTHIFFTTTCDFHISISTSLLTSFT